MALSHLGSGSQRTRYGAQIRILVDAKDPSAYTREEFSSRELVERGGDILLRIGVAAGGDHASFLLRHPRKNHGRPFVVSNTVGCRRFVPDVASRLLLPLTGVAIVPRRFLLSWLYLITVFDGCVRVCL